MNCTRHVVEDLFFAAVNPFQTSFQLLNPMLEALRHRVQPKPWPDNKTTYLNLVV